jgi:hypothetical protein
LQIADVNDASGSSIKYKGDRSDVVWFDAEFAQPGQRQPQRLRYDLAGAKDNVGINEPME